MTHAKLSPSSAARWMVCPGSVVLSAGIPDRVTVPKARGTVAHVIADACLTDELDPASFLGQVWPVNEEGVCESGAPGAIEVTVDDDLVAIVTAYVDYTRALAATCDDNCWMSEVKLPIGHLTGEDGAVGTADFVGLAGRTLLVVDLKTGYNEVEADGNKQLRIYALGAIEQFAPVWEFDDVRCIIVQPTVGDPKDATYTVGQLRAFAAEVRDAAQAVKFAEAQHEAEGFISITYLQVEDEACRWCPASATCPALRRAVDEAVATEFDDLTQAAAVSDDDLGAAMARVEMVEAWCKAVRAEVERRLLASVPVPGWKLVVGRRGARKWTDPERVEKVLRDALKDDAYERKLISPTTAEKVLKKERPLTWNVVAEFVAQSEGSPSVAPESDKREALILTPVADEFEVLT